MPSTEPTGESFRDSLATIDAGGRRVWVYPIKPRGKLSTARRLLTPFLLAFLFAAPFIRVNDNPLMLFDILNRRFFIFGVGFWPQDFHLLVLGAIAVVLFTVLFTAAFGRLFCGWVCPQTVFMEMVFRPIEFLLEGDGFRQRRLDQADWTFSKAWRKIVKHMLFYAIAFLIGNTLMAWTVGGDKLMTIITASPAEHPAGFGAVLVFSLVFYGVFARFREQACTMVCPYGRLQSVLLDDNSVVIAYDFKRGEPRAKLKPGKTRTTDGDCIDCLACVRVCPTGIDIRNGTQLECINCTACIDACNRVMAKAGRPPKLIRYSSYNRIAHGRRFSLTPRMIAYTVGLVGLLTALTIMVSNRSEVETTILRTSGKLYEVLDDGYIRNLYTVKIVNKTPRQLRLQLVLVSELGRLNVVGPPLLADGYSIAESVFTIEMPADGLLSTSSLVLVEVKQEQRVLEEVRTTFSSPEPSW